MQSLWSYFFGKKTEVLPPLFETVNPVKFSIYADGAFEKHWKPWCDRHFEVRPEGTLLFRKHKNRGNSKTLHVNDFTINRVPLSADAKTGSLKELLILKIECRRDTEDGLLTHFRCILSKKQTIALCHAVKQISNRHNIESFLSDLTANTADIPLDPEAGDSIMKMSLKAIDRGELESRRAYIKKRRGAFKYLPVYFSNDLIHGSWWFVFGSLFVLGISIVVLLSTYHDTVLGTDDSVLGLLEFRVTWYLLIFSGFMFTLGSLAFLRAVNELPMKPIFKWKHLATDELLGAWCFFWAIIPAIPYCVIFLAYTEELIFAGLLFVAILCVLGGYFFVLACYPSVSKIQMNSSVLLRYLTCCFGRSDFLRNHCATDWLAACWIIFWGSGLMVVLLFLFTIYSYAQGESTLANFVNITGVIDTLFFLVGSAYFVAGSYPVIDISFGDQYQTEMNTIEMEMNESFVHTTTPMMQDQGHPPA